MYPFEEVYATMLGESEPEEALPWVKNAFQEGYHCARLSAEIRDAYGRICERLGVWEEDEDLETIVNDMLEMQKELCENMFHYGMDYVRERRYLGQG